MARAENSLSRFPPIYPYVRRIYAASEADDLVDAVSEYLASWSNHKIQRVDGGWGPVDRYGRSRRLRSVADINRIGERVRRQRVALEEVGIVPNPEFVELDLLLSIAKRVAGDRMAITSRKNAWSPV